MDYEVREYTSIYRILEGDNLYDCVEIAPCEVYKRKGCYVYKNEL